MYDDQEDSHMKNISFQELGIHPYVYIELKNDKQHLIDEFYVKYGFKKKESNRYVYTNKTDMNDIFRVGIFDPNNKIFYPFNIMRTGFSEGAHFL